VREALEQIEKEEEEGEEGREEGKEGEEEEVGTRLLLLDGLESEEGCLDVFASLASSSSSSSSFSSSPSSPLNRSKLVVVAALCTSTSNTPLSSSSLPSSSSFPSSSLLGVVHAHFGLPLLTDLETEILPTLRGMVGGREAGRAGGREGGRVTMRGLEGVAVMAKALGEGGREGEEGGWTVEELLENVWV